MDKRLHNLKDYLKKHRINLISRRVTTFLAALVIFTVTYILLMPAISLDKSKADGSADINVEKTERVLDCHFEFHQHTDDCYKEFKVYNSKGRKVGTEKVLICDKPEAVVHVHDDSCYQDVITSEEDNNGNITIVSERVLVCPLPELESHVHDDTCYKEDRVLVCGLEETRGHTHTDECYETENVLTCDKEEHVHDEGCYSEKVISTEKVLICPYDEGEIISPAVYSDPVYSEPVYDEETGDLIQEGELIQDAQLISEAVVHNHTDQCYETVENKQEQLTCGYDEHVHTDECYTENTTLICGMEEEDAHRHTDECYEVTRALICDKPEAEVHIHTKDCYEKVPVYNKKGKKIGTEKVLICGKNELPEHVHTDECFRTVEPAEAVESSEFVEAAETVEATEPAEAAETVEAAESTEAAEPVEAAETFEAAEPAAQTEEIEAAATPEATWDGESDTDKTSIKRNNIPVDGASYSINIEYCKDAGIPDDAVFTAAALDESSTEYTEYTNKALDALSDSKDSNKDNKKEQKVYGLFDLTVYSSDGEVIQPIGPINISIDFSESEHTVKTNSDSDLFAVHFPGTTLVDGEVKAEGEPSAPEIIEAAAKDKDNILFETEGFSIFAIVETTIEKNVLTSDGQNYHITVTCGADSGIPEDADLEVEEILPDEMDDAEDEAAAPSLYEEYVTKTENALGMEEGSAGYIRLFDISIVKDGEKIQPANGSSVAVQIELADSRSEELNVVHFADGEEEGEKVECSTVNSEEGTVLEFETGSFSVYSIVDARDPISYTPAGWYTANSVDQIAELGEDGFYVNWNKYYLTGDLVPNVSGNIDRDGLDATPAQYNSVPEDLAAKFYFTRQGPDTFKISTDGEGEAKKYVKLTPVSGNAARAGLTFVNDESKGTAFTVEKDGSNNRFYISAKLSNGTEYWWNRNTNSSGGVGAFVGFNVKGNSNTARVTLSYYVAPEPDLYDLDGKSFGIAYYDDSVTAAAMMAESKTVGNQTRFEGIDMLMRADVLNNKGVLLVAENSDIQEWTFESIEGDKYYIKTNVDGAEKYLRINYSSVTLVDDQTSASVITATPGTESNRGKWHFTTNNNYSLNFTGSAANGFNAANNNSASTWLTLVEKSTLTEDDFTNYSARKISASDDILSGTEEGKAQVIIYTRVWNDEDKKYEFYAVDHDGSLVRVYDSGDKINWIGNQVNSALWEFTEYTNTDGSPNYFYELENTAYTGTYLVPQSDSIISHDPVGINLNGRREGFDYSSIISWDDAAYAYSGLKVEKDEDGSLKVVACSLDEAEDFYFAIMTPPVEEADPTTTVATVDNKEYGISIKMVDFNNKIVSGRDTVQTAFFGTHPWDQNHAYDAETGLLSTKLTNGYPTIMAATEKNGHSLSELFTGMTAANHLFIQSVYNESGYFEYDSTQNFAHLNDDGTFTVYNQLGAIGTSTNNTRVHGQFMPYNDISAETGYAYDDQGNLITNQRDIKGQELPDSDPRKGEPLYLIPQDEADYYYGMELSAVFTQTPDGVDNWGHDIIFEFTGDDDFWFYVDGELVLDLGGVHSAVGGKVNFRTGEVICNNTTTTLYDIFKSNYQARELDVSEVDDLFVTKTVNGQTVHVFKDYTSHEMKMFYMERGGGASNLRMRFNLASVKPGTAELSKILKGIDKTTNKLIQYPYQIWYQTAEYEMNEDGTYKLDSQGNRIIDHYDPAIRLTQPPPNSDLTGQVYAVYKGTKTLIPYKASMDVGGYTYKDVFLLKAGETAVINFPENTYRYKIVECGVDTSVYEHIYVNGETADDEIFGKPLENNDGWDPESGAEIIPDQTTTYEGSNRTDFGVTFETTENRPRAEYINEATPEVMRTISLKKVLYDTEGNLLTDEQAAQIMDTFTFRLYLGNEFANQKNLPPANMYHYYIKDPDGNYCKWDKASQSFVSLGVGSFDDFKNLSEAEQKAGTFTTSMYGSISKIRAGYTVEVRDLIVGTKYKVEERGDEIPKGYTRRDSDGYVRTDLAEGHVVYYTQEGVYGQHPYAVGSTTTAEAISDTITSKTESPEIEIRNQQGWGLTVTKEWTDKDFVVHDPIYFAIYLKNQDGSRGDLVEESVRRLNKGEKEVYWFFPDLHVNNGTHTFDEFMIREVTLTDPIVDESTGVVTGYTDITPVENGGSISVGVKTAAGTQRTETYNVSYAPGDSTGQNQKIRNDTVTNSRPGIQIYKMKWDGTTPLAGAVFTLKDAAGHDVGAAEYKSDSKGFITTAYLSQGTYTLNEIRTPAGYVALDEPILIHVTNTIPNDYDFTVTSGNETYYIKVTGPEGFYTCTGATATNMARITVKNRTLEGLKIVKFGVDGETSLPTIPLSGIHFSLYEQVKDGEGHLRPAYSAMDGYEDIVTAADGTLEAITKDLEPGTYYLRENEAPSGYKKLAHDLCFTLGEDGKVTINNAEYTNWLSTDKSVPGSISYQINVENMPLGIAIMKTDDKGVPLPGAKFELSKLNDNNSFVNVTEYGLGQDGLIDLTDKTEITFTGMANGTYKLSETYAPPGYIILTKDIYFKVSDGTVTLTDESGDKKDYSDVFLEDDDTTIVVKNNPGTALPNTGGCGTKPFYLLGIMLACLAGIGLLIRGSDPFCEKGV